MPQFSIGSSPATLIRPRVTSRPAAGIVPRPEIGRASDGTRAIPSSEVLWRRYRTGRKAAARALLLERYLKLVHQVARQVRRRVGDRIELDDLISAGTLGLMQTVERFEASRGLAFSTYAVPRIRGAMMDELRTIDWVPRSVRAQGRAMATAVERLESTLARAPRAAEVAGALRVATETYSQWRQQLAGSVLGSLDERTATAEGSGLELGDTLADLRQDLPDAHVLQEEAVGRMRKAIGTLPPQERTVLALYYYEELTLRQIGEVLHLTESRISQIRTRALDRLRHSGLAIGDCS